jgi:phosphohistidine swiveling domain-containing protein
MAKLVQAFRELNVEQNSFAGAKGTSAGGKGASLAQMFQAGFPVPDGFVIQPAAFEDDLLKPGAWEEVLHHLTRLREAHDQIAFAVRSSALSEDSAEASFAGEFESVLNVRDDEEIRTAIHTVYGSRHNERVKAYSQAKGMDSEHEVAVVVQQLVEAESSGVMFTADPVSGRRDQAMITAAWGLGEAVVGGLVTPDTLIVEKATGRIVSQEIADKRVMTVRIQGGTEEVPVPEERRHAAVLSEEKAAELAALGVRIESFFGTPMDIEWVLSGGAITVVQARPITTLPEPEPPPPTEWKLPKGYYVAMRNNIVELMADPLTPLFGTLGLAAVNASMNRTLAGVFGKPGLMPEELIITVNDFAYYNGSLSARQMARIFLSSIGIVKHMFSGAVERWTEDERPRYIATVKAWDEQPWRQLSTSEILGAARELSEAAIDAYMALVSGVLPAAWISEGLLTAFFNLLIRRRHDPPAYSFLLGFDSAPILAEKELYDLAKSVRAQPRLAAYLAGAPTPEIAAHFASGARPPQVEDGEWQEWRDAFRAHLHRHGHAIYNLDFSNPVPADDPAPLLDTFKMFINGQGSDPYERQRAATERREEVTQSVLGRLKRLRLRLFRRFLASAQRYAPLREDGLAEVGLSYPLLRQMLREVGGRLVAGGMIDSPDDIFWLRQDEVESAAARLDRGEALESAFAVVLQRKASWRAARRVAPPMMLPQLKLFGVDIAKMKSGRARGKDGGAIKGVAASPGQVTAPASVVHGPDEFGHMKTGDVLVAALTTPAWTPLFARASAVVTDIGGPLSHGSIVAREYGIPAVLGTAIATERIQNGQVITVDGSNGTVTVSQNDNSGNGRTNRNK